MVSEIFDPALWDQVPGFDFKDITYHRAKDQGTVRIAFNRPEVRNAFRPGTVDELFIALDHARMTTDVGVVLLTGNGPSPKDGGWAFCSGGDQRIRGADGYKYEGASGIDPGRLTDAAMQVQLCGNLLFAAAMCRIHYYRKPESLPVADDDQELGEYWKAFYNTAGGHGTADQFVDNLRRVEGMIDV